MENRRRLLDLGLWSRSRETTAMSRKDEPVRPEARLPKGLFDASANELRATGEMLAKIRDVFESYGFEPLDTPAIEYTDALGKFLPDQDRPNEGVFSFKDDDYQWLSLRYDLTAPLARYVAEKYQNLPKPFRRYQCGPVWRNEKPGPGRFRQFIQFDADTVGAASVAADAELCMLAADTLEALGIPRGQYEVKYGYEVRLNSRQILDGVMESIGLGGDANARKRLASLRALDKYGRLGKEGVRELLGFGRRDDSGDFTPGAGLDEEQTKRLIQFVTIRREPWGIVESTETHFNPQIRLLPEGGGNPYEMDVLSAIDRACGANDLVREAIKDLRDIEKFIASSGYGNGRVLFDPSVVRGLEYYTGPVFEAELTAPITDDRGQAIRLGSVVSGGRYDGLVERFTGEKVPATGMSIGISRLFYGLKTLGKIPAETVQGPVVVLVLDRDRVADYQKMAQDLRKAGIRAELYLGESGMKAQMKYADKRGSPCVVIQGGDERAKGEITIKDLVEGAERSKTVADNVAWREERPGQFTVPEADMVKAVRGVLARHKA
jgi:histidyl-tRNA synthetase